MGTVPKDKIIELEDDPYNTSTQNKLEKKLKINRRKNTQKSEQ